MMKRMIMNLSTDTNETFVMKKNLSYCSFCQQPVRHRQKITALVHVEKRTPSDVSGTITFEMLGELGHFSTNNWMSRGVIANSPHYMVRRIFGGCLMLTNSQVQLKPN